MPDAQPGETEVFRIIQFDKEKCYAFALYTRKEGSWPNELYYTTNEVKYLGKYTHSERWGYGENRGGAENFFIDDENKPKVIYDDESKTCFKDVPC
jgi:hypothetical protein